MKPFDFLSRRSAVAMMAATIGLAGMASPSLAADYPSKPVTMIIPYGAGGGTDTMGRVFANALGNELGQPVVVVNRKGGGGSVGASFLKNSAPDGHTILMGGVDEIAAWNTIASDVDLAAGDFRFLGAVANYQNAFVAPADQPFTTFAEFVDHAKTNPGLPVVSQGGMSATFLDIVAEKEGLDLRVVNANSGSEAMQLLIAGNAVMSYSGGIHANYADQIKVLASLNDTRLSAYPDAPTFKESGYGLNMPSLIGVMAPAAISDDVAATLEAALQAATQDADFLTIVEERLKSKVEVVSGDDVTAAISEMAEKYQDVASR
jgi:tripartite-type tricarboxylate transporter receptor subunit TctC